MKKRCDWVNLKNDLYVKYHDEEWGVPLHDENKLFEALILDGAQAGLSWEMILNKRENYRKAYDNFDPKKVAKYSEEKILDLLEDAGIVRNRLKVRSSVKNAKVFLEIQKEFGSFDKYLWNFVDGKPVKNKLEKLEDFPAKTDLSDKISKDLKKRGMSFVGSTIIYAMMQAIGMVNDHQVGCFRYDQV
ncbi:MAG: DNA-3-methyladenine glycosylase I [Candidatus Pacebacteria bacterium]|nr:DNA-3-methyladenine glycosylase I [Candidatus Paceibacterota bacterium]